MSPINLAIDFVEIPIFIENVLSPVPTKIYSIENSTNQGISKPHPAEWVIQRIKDSPSSAAGILLAWTHPKQIREITDDLVEQIRNLSQHEAKEVLERLAIPKQYI